MSLRAIPVPFDGDAEKSALVSTLCLVTFDRNRYNVESRFVRQAMHAMLAEGIDIRICAAPLDEGRTEHAEEQLSVTDS